VREVSNSAIGYTDMVMRQVASAAVGTGEVDDGGDARGRGVGGLYISALSGFPQRNERTQEEGLVVRFPHNNSATNI
jgi:hypothetical protein